MPIHRDTTADAPIAPYLVEFYILVVLDLAFYIWYFQDVSSPLGEWGLVAEKDSVANAFLSFSAVPHAPIPIC